MVLWVARHVRLALRCRSAIRRKKRHSRFGRIFLTIDVAGPNDPRSVSFQLGNKSDVGGWSTLVVGLSKCPARRGSRKIGRIRLPYDEWLIRRVDCDSKPQIAIAMAGVRNHGIAR